MILSQLLVNSVYAVLKGNVEVEISEIVSDSRKVTKGCVFVCISGNHFDGHSTICQVLADGACAIIVERLSREVEELLTDDDRECTVILVESSKKNYSEMWNCFCRFPLQHMTIVGITGTKGKTTTSFFLKAILEAHGLLVGLVGTNGIFDGREWKALEYTTPEPEILFPALQTMVENGCEVVVMEVSSIGMRQSRLEGILFDYGLFTNFFPDHIGGAEHKDLEEYFYWKKQFFFQCKQAIFWRCNASEQIVRECTIPCEYVETELEIPLLMGGHYNRQNAALAWRCGEKIMGSYFSKEKAAKACGGCKVAGRMELVYEGLFRVYIDYAHNGESLRQLLTTLRELRPGRLICLFGCGGNRSEERRMQMGEVSGNLADLTILTSDNSRWEEPQKIIQQIEKGVLQSGGKYEIIVSREAAIEQCILHAQEGDFIVLAGKGHEEYMEVNGVRQPFSEREIVRRAIEMRNSKL